MSDGILFVVLFSLGLIFWKLEGSLAWPWAVVLMPLYGSLALGLVILIIFIVIGIIVRKGKK